MLQKVGVPLFVLPVMFTAAQALAAQGWVDAWGEAQIKNGDKVAAKQAAVADGLKRCIEKVVGITIVSQFDSTMREVVKNNQNQFDATVQDRLVKKSKGFIDKYEVLEERLDMDVMKVHVKALVYEDKLVAEVEKITALIKKCGNPKVMIVIQDVHINPEGNEKVAPESQLALHLEDMLMKRGLQIRGKSAAKDITTGSARRYDRWAQETDHITEMAVKNKADMLVFGRVEIKDKGEIKNATFAALNGQRRIEIETAIRGINAVTGELFSSKPDQMSSIGINLEKAMKRAMTGRGKNLITRTFEPLFEDMKSSCRKAADKGNTFVVILKGIKSFRKQGRKFVKILERIDGISGVEHSYAEGTLSVELACKCAADELQDRIFDEVDNSADKAVFDTLDVSGVDGKRIRLKM